MVTASRSIVYSLLTVVLVLLLGIMALLWVAYNRHQRLEDATIDLRRNLSQQETQIQDLQERLEDCDTVVAPAPANTLRRVASRTDSARLVRRVGWPMQ